MLKNKIAILMIGAVLSMPVQSVFAQSIVSQKTVVQEDA